MEQHKTYLLWAFVLIAHTDTSALFLFHNHITLRCGLYSRTAFIQANTVNVT
jgi:hypothetical protein